MILLITNEQDVTCDLAVLQLRERGIPYLRLNTDAFLADGGLTSALGGDQPGTTVRWRGRAVDVREVTAVWYRRPVHPRPAVSIRDPAARTLATQEGEAALQNLWTLLNGLWVSPPEAIRRAEPKLRQLACAAALGLEVPPTLLTNDPLRAQEFCRTYGETVAKPLGRGVVDDPVDGPLSRCG